MTDKIVVFVTAGSLRESKKIARRLVESRLAACVNITSPIRSIYRWQDKIEDAGEYVLIIKTRRDLFESVRAVVAKIHTYTTPEIISVPIVDGAADYLEWLDRSLVEEPEGDASPR